MSGTAAKMTAQKPFGELLGLFARRHVDTCLWRERKRAEGSTQGRHRGDTDGEKDEDKGGETERESM